MKKNKKKLSTVQIRRNEDLNMKLNYLSEKTGIAKEPEIIRMAITELYNKYMTSDQSV
jgi:predicted DNA-binding protein